MDKDGYIVHVTPTFAVLIGASDHSSAWAQFDFAREYLGIDVYFPGKCGLVVPRHERVRVPIETRVETPAFLSRAFSAINTYRVLRGQPDIPWREYATTDDETEWRAELKLSFQKLRFAPKQFPYLRVNLVRNVKGGGHSGIAWFPSTGGHASYDARGWVLFE